MKEFHKIQTLWVRPEDTHNHGKFLKWVVEGRFANPVFEMLQNIPWVWTEKVDGTNIRILWDGQQVRFGGKTDDSQIPMQLLAVLQDIFSPAKLAEIFPGPVCLYGEGYGHKIQKAGELYRPDGTTGFVLIDVWIPAAEGAGVPAWWLERPNKEAIAERLGLEIVPIIGVGTLLEMSEKVKQGFHSRWGNFPAEGIVAVPEVELFNRKGERVITKLKHKDFRPEWRGPQKGGEE